METSLDWARIWELFAAALEKTPEERSAFLEMAANDDAEVRRRVQALVRAAEGDDQSFLETARMAAERSGRNAPSRRSHVVESADMFGSMARGMGAHPGRADRERDPESTVDLGGRSGCRSPPSIPDYDCLRCIGVGGIGEVWLAKNRIDHQHYAVKLFPASASLELEGLREYKHRVAEHPHLVPIEHVGQAGACCYYVMPPADDACATSPLLEVDQYEPLTLERALARQGRFPIGEVVNVARQMLSALAHLHNQGARHGDVKPTNILKLRGRWQLADHGLVSNFEGDGPRACTPAYCPAEGPGGRDADLYALGKTLFEIATGARPHQTDALPNGELGIPGKDPRAAGLTGVIRRACAEEPSERFARAEEMLEAIEAVVVGPRRPWWRQPKLAAALVVAAVALPLGWSVIDMYSAPPEIEALDVLVYEDQDDQRAIVGEIGFPSQRATAEHSVILEVALDRPAYCYVIAFNPDGSSVLCYPESETEPPPRTRRIEAPLREGTTYFYKLSDGLGTQAFVVVASGRPLPDYATWRGRLTGLGGRVSGLEWRPPVTTGAWKFDGLRLSPLGGLRGVEAPGDRPDELESLCAAIGSAEGADVVRAIAFPVVEADGRSAEKAKESDP